MADLRRDLYTEFRHLAGAIMEYFLERIAPLRHWYIDPNTSLLFLVKLPNP